jgi:hypothetical protein
VQHTKTGENIPDDHKIYQMAIKIPNGGKIDQMAIKYYNIFKTLRNLHLLSFLVWKYIIWQSWPLLLWQMLLSLRWCLFRRLPNCRTPKCRNSNCRPRPRFVYIVTFNMPRDFGTSLVGEPLVWKMLPRLGILLMHSELRCSTKNLLIFLQKTHITSFFTLA